jgi:hypothetical protein
VGQKCWQLCDKSHEIRWRLFTLGRKAGIYRYRSPRGADLNQPENGMLAKVEACVLVNFNVAWANRYQPMVFHVLVDVACGPNRIVRFVFSRTPIKKRLDSNRCDLLVLRAVKKK